MVNTISHSVRRVKYHNPKSRIYRITPTPMLSKIKILDATPQFIRRYALNEEQVLLAIIRYNRLIDAFLGLTCYSLQSYLRTTVPGLGQRDTDEVYIGVNEQWRPFVIPVQVKGKNKPISTVQAEQDMAVCEAKFPALLCRPVAAQFIENDVIALFEFVRSKGEISIREERHYRIVPNELLSDEEIESYDRGR